MIKILVISSESFFRNEAIYVDELFAAGLQVFHLRKPNASKEDLADFIKEINPIYRNRIALHPIAIGSHHELALGPDSYRDGINRLHFTEENRLNLITNGFERKEGFIYSTSFHSIEDAQREGEAFDYYFLSPIMDSISKSGYQGKKMKSPSSKAVALGGICLENLEEVKDLGYENIAVLGAIWQEPENALERFVELKEKWDNVRITMNPPRKTIKSKIFGFSVPSQEGILVDKQLKAKIKNPKPETRYLKSSSQNPKPETRNPKPKILTIAGFDPSGGAGIIRDAAVIRDFGSDSYRMECLGVLTCNTIQNETTFESVHWLSQKEIEAQIDVLKEERVAVVKIGLTRDIEMIQFILNKVKSNFPKAKIVLDPILRTSSGFSMEHPDRYQDQKKWIEIIEQVDVLTPNWTEMQTISGNENIEEMAKDPIAIGWSKFTAICLKGGHSPHPEMDLLFVDGERIEIKGRNEKLNSRHGSGCTFSTAFACALAMGPGNYRDRLVEAARVAKNKTEEYLIEGSSEVRLKHKPMQSSLTPKRQTGRMTDDNKAKSL